MRSFDRFDVFILKNKRGNVVDSICLATRYRYFIKFQSHSPVNFLGCTLQIGQMNTIELASFSLHLLVKEMIKS